MHGVGENVVRN